MKNLLFVLMVMVGGIVVMVIFVYVSYSDCINVCEIVIIEKVGEEVEINFDKVKFWGSFKVFYWFEVMFGEMEEVYKCYVKGSCRNVEIFEFGVES